jgi:hypothetical protein
MGERGGETLNAPKHGDRDFVVPEGRGPGDADHGDRPLDVDLAGGERRKLLRFGSRRECSGPEGRWKKLSLH